MNDPTLVRVGQGAEDLSGGLDRRGIVDLSAPQRLAKSASRNVLVGDVHVARVPAEPIGALAGRMAQPGRRLRLPLGAGGRLALARDDLQSDVEPVALVTSKPDGAGTAASERPQRPIASEHEFALDQGWGCIR